MPQKFDINEEKIYWYRQGKDPRSIEAALDFLNSFHEEQPKSLPTLYEKWYTYYAKKHGVSATTVRNRVMGVLRLYDIKWEDFRHGIDERQEEN